MKFAVSSLAFVLAATVGTALAAETAPAKPMTAQQTKMSTCSKEGHAKGLKGPDYKAFMSTCLKGSDETAHAAASTNTAPPASPVAAPHNTDGKAKMAQREKMKTCNADATSKNLKGHDRQTFMSTCLKGDHAPAPAAAATH